ncbi:MAG: glutamate-5-semialdehyde dehydrogenase [Thermodesulfobacteriota bacterium]|nr:glutamate-5-semialdehyde dehydrogenase [Thermodesulfobacteriota bacterium]
MVMADVKTISHQAKGASRELASASSKLKAGTLNKMAVAIRENVPFLQAENKKDVDRAVEKGLSGVMIDRLKLTDGVIESMAVALDEIADLPDPVGKISDMTRRPNGLLVGRMRIPLGVIGMIYESRPNVTSDAAGLCIKSGNAVILRGGSEAFNSNMAIAKILRQAIEDSGINPNAMSVIPVTDRSAVMEMLTLEDDIDLIIPRGGEDLIRTVVSNSRIPVLKHYKGVCHIFVDQDADLDKAYKICLNAKVQKSSVCNAMETLLVDERVADKFLPEMIRQFKGHGVDVRGCERTASLIPGIKNATEQDWHEEYLDLILAVKVVDNIKEAIDHIEKYGSNHTEAIITENYSRAMKFLKQVDSSTVLVNASTRFSDGGEFGLGAEVGISTSKIHAYGPMGIEDLTIEKFICFGDGQIRQ